MRINCSQCGAEQIVLESDFLLRCPYCDSRIFVDPPRNTPALVEPSIDSEAVRRLFPSDMVNSVEMLLFPYFETSGSGQRQLLPCFNQPWQELESYNPPAGDRKVFDDSLVDPEQVIPFDRQMAQQLEGRLVLHPFFVVMLKLEGYSEGVLVDGVSGKVLGDVPSMGDQEEDSSLYRLFLLTLLGGLAVSIPVYFLSKSLDMSWISRIWSFALITGFAALVYNLRKGRRG